MKAAGEEAKQALEEQQQGRRGRAAKEDHGLQQQSDRHGVEH